MGLEVNEGPGRKLPRGKGTMTSAPALSAQIVADANRIEYATDANGRSIGVKRLNALSMFELTLVLGDHASNQSALIQALAVSSVVEIDGDPVRAPITMLELKALMKRLDFPGISAVNEALNRFNATSDAGADAAKNL